VKLVTQYGHLRTMIKDINYKKGSLLMQQLNNVLEFCSTHPLRAKLYCLIINKNGIFI
jgi:hypothetical protein